MALNRYPAGFVWLATVLISAVLAHSAETATYSASLSTSALQPGRNAVVAVVLEIAPGLHAQSHTPLDENLIKLVVKPDPNLNVEFLDPIYPPPALTNFVGLGMQSVYTGKVVIYLPLRAKGDAPIGDTSITGKITWQACNDQACFAPERNKPFIVSTHFIPGSFTVTANEPELFTGFDANVFDKSPASTTQASNSSTTQPTTKPTVGAPSGGMIIGGSTRVSIFGHSFELANRSFLLAEFVAFVAGILFNVVPCVLPVLPVKAMGFYEASQHNRGRTILLGTAFSLGLIAVFVVLGMAVILSKSLFGTQFAWGQQFSYPAFVWGVAIVLGLLGVGMMGAFSLQLPTGIYGLDFRHDTLSGNFMWGGLTAVLSTPCTAPLFPPVLAYAAGLPRAEGFLLMVIVGAGMSSPYLVLSAFPQLAQRFPRTGQAADLVKQMMGFLLLGSAAFFAGLELVGDPNQWWIVFAVAVWGCLYLVIRSAQIFKSASALYIATALAVAITGGMLAISLRMTDLLSSRGAGASTESVQWQPYTPQTLAASRDARQVVLIDFTASWCLNCKYIEGTVFHDPRALAALRKYNVVTLKADLTDSNAPGFPLLNDLGGDGIPLTAIYFPDAKEPVRISSIYTTDTLLSALERTGG